MTSVLLVDGKLRGEVVWLEAPASRWTLDLTPDGRIDSLTVAGGTEGVTARGLHQVPLRVMEAAIRRWYLEMVLEGPGSERLTEVFDIDEEGRVVRRPASSVEAESWATSHDLARRAAESFRNRAPQKRPGRAGRGDDYYLELAASYAALLADGDINAAQTLADQRFTSVKTIRNQLRRARDLELLTEPPPGKAGGALTPKALRLIAEAEETAKETTDGER